MKPFDIILFSLSIGFFIIAVHLTMTLGILHAYWVLMLSVSLFLYYRYRKVAKAVKNKEKIISRPKRSKRKARKAKY